LPRSIWWISALASGVIVLWLAWLRFFPDPLGAALAAYKRKAWSEAEALVRRRLADRPDDREAWRLLARSAGRQRQDAAAQALYRQRLGLEAMMAEDFVIAAAGLRRGGQIDQARIALDKARAREPDHPEMLYELASLDAASDRLAEGAELAERLITHAGWEARGWLVLAQIRESADDPAGTAAALTRALDLGSSETTRDTSFSDSSARKRLARALLRTGRPAEAGAHLAKVNALARDSEASWLLSRALLQQGDISGAAAALAQAGAYASHNPMLSEPAGFLGAARCAECHSSFYRSQQKSRHSRTFHPTSELADIPPFKGPIIDTGDARVRHVLRHEVGRLRWETTDMDRAVAALVDFAFGSGDVAITLVGKDAGGTARELRLSHYGEAALWDITTGHLSQPGDRREFLGRDLGRDGTRRCLECHTTSARVALARDGPAAGDRGIGCERCHGPGANHLAALSARFPEPAIARPRLASAQQIMALCSACHSPKDAKITPGDHLAPRFASTSLGWSACYTKSGGALSCLSCHDPHRDAETSASFYEVRCLACHSTNPATPTRGPHPRLPVRPADMQRSICSVNPARDCLTCHMPKIGGIVPHTQFSDHHIRVRPGTSPSGQSGKTADKNGARG
jgi:tetratricopeptide (TPR) repeat protein